MFGFEPTEEQKMLVEAVRRYAENDLRTAAHEADESGELPPDLMSRISQMIREECDKEGE